ncbi:hypothetical protein [Amycolatopsis sp. NPDC051128]|uniref:hypothetical protein n=1 Tax=Amycolatopsis sp. NPDC051128 TaxID=3155412 RepID=UPI00342993DA
MGGQPLVLEVFGSSAALAAHLPGLLDAAALDAALLNATPVSARAGMTAVTGSPSARPARTWRRAASLPARVTWHT